MSNLLIGFSDPATPIMEGIVDLHNYIFFYLILILVLVLWMFFVIIEKFWHQVHFPVLRRTWAVRKQMMRMRLYNHSKRLEIFWTIVPSLILINIAIPSFALLYAMDEVYKPCLTFKAIGHQWYWSYEYTDYVIQNKSGSTSNAKVIFDSNCVFESDLKLGEFRLLQVDNPVVLPVDLNIRCLITSFDVIHSWALPSFGVKCDAVPGRLNQVMIHILREGVFYGQCSELCGVNHGFMPITVKAVSLDEYKQWITHQTLSLSN